MTSSRAQRRKRRTRLESARFLACLVLGYMYFLACLVLGYMYLRDLAQAVYRPTVWSVGVTVADLAAMGFLLLFVPLGVRVEVRSAR